MSLATCKKLRCNNLVKGDFQTIAQADAAGELSQEQQRALRNIQSLWCNTVAELCPAVGRVCIGPVEMAEWVTTKALRGDLTDDQLAQLSALDEKTMHLIEEALFPAAPSQQ